MTGKCLHVFWFGSFLAAAVTYIQKQPQACNIRICPLVVCLLLAFRLPQGSGKDREEPTNFGLEFRGEWHV